MVCLNPEFGFSCVFSESSFQGNEETKHKTHLCATNYYKVRSNGNKMNSCSNYLLFGQYFPLAHLLLINRQSHRNNAGP